MKCDINPHIHFSTRKIFLLLLHMIWRSSNLQVAKTNLQFAKREVFMDSTKGKVTQLIVIKQFCKLLNTWLVCEFTLIITRGKWSKMASNWSLYFGNYEWNTSFQNFMSSSCMSTIGQPWTMALNALEWGTLPIT